MLGWMTIFALMAVLGLTTAAWEIAPHPMASMATCIVFSALLVIAVLTRAIRRRA